MKILKPYFITNGQNATIECGGLNLRIGDTCMGVAIFPRQLRDRTAIMQPFWRKLLLPISVSINHIVGAGQLRYFTIELGALSIYFNGQPKHYCLEKSEKFGFHMAWRWARPGRKACHGLIF